MVILNAFEPWPVEMVLPAAERHDVRLITRVADFGGIFHDDVKPGHTFAEYDHRSFRPEGWVEQGAAKLEQVRPIAERHGLTMLQFACPWVLAQPAVACAAPPPKWRAGATPTPNCCSATCCKQRTSCLSWRGAITTLLAPIPAPLMPSG